MPKQPKKKKTIYIKEKKLTGVCRILDWDRKKKKYIKRKRKNCFMAYKRLGGKQIQKQFDNTSAALKWRRKKENSDSEKIELIIDSIVHRVVSQTESFIKNKKNLREDLLDIKQVKKMFRISEKSLYRIANKPECPTMRIGNKIMFSMPELIIYFRNQGLKKAAKRYAKTA